MVDWAWNTNYQSVHQSFWSIVVDWALATNYQCGHQSFEPPWLTELWTAIINLSASLAILQLVMQAQRSLCRLFACNSICDVLSASSCSGGGQPGAPTPSIAFRHLPPNSARFSYATEGALFISAISALPNVWVLIWLWKQPSAQVPT